ncbi:hypothetical protein [Microvirga sp. M2]|uniref:hypothetical protein n=1 Tax=Microvirga sp. M2 TaxID=3073270 RepID=UPI0039C44D1F
MTEKHGAGHLRVQHGLERQDQQGPDHGLEQGRRHDQAGERRLHGLEEDRHAEQELLQARQQGDLWYDANGNKAGGQVVFAHIGKNKAIAHNDFIVV